MPPTCDPRTLAAVEFYLDGNTAKAAIHKAKANCGERNVQNLAKATGRKRKRTPPSNSKKKKKKGRRKSFNLHPDQTESKAVDDLGLTRERHDAFKKATSMLRDSQLARERAGGRRPRGCESAATIVKQLNDKLSDGVKPLSATSVKEAVRLGRVGISPKKAGRVSRVPSELTNVAHSYVGVMQITTAIKFVFVAQPQQACTRTSIKNKPEGIAFLAGLTSPWLLLLPAARIKCESERLRAVAALEAATAAAAAALSDNQPPAAPTVSINTATTADQVDVVSMTRVEKRALLAKLHAEMNKE